MILSVANNTSGETVEKMTVADIVTSETLFVGTPAQCAWFIDVKGLTLHGTARSGDTVWVK